MTNNDWNKLLASIIRSIEPELNEDGVDQIIKYFWAGFEEVSESEDYWEEEA